MPHNAQFMKKTSVSFSTHRSRIQGREREYITSAEKLPHLLDLSYLELEERNLELKSERISGTSNEVMRGKMIEYLKRETGIKAITVFFTDLEGRFHALDYDKKHFIDSEDNLTFDGSSIHGFTEQKESDLRLKIDWTSFRFAPSDLFGCGKVLIFAYVCEKDGSPYGADFRYRLSQLCERLKKERGLTMFVAPEIEGFLFKGIDAEQNFDEKVGFELATMSGYFNSLPQDILRIFIDKFAEAQRALGFQNEKDHPEVAPAQFELNFRYSVAIDTADQIQLYKLIARQIAKSMGMSVSFLPKPVQKLNGSGMHTNISIAKNGKNIFFDARGEHKISETASRFLTGILYYANDLCLVMNSSVNAYRRLDPHFEAPNEIKVSAIDRGSMVRIPIGNEKSTRIEVRTVAPDANPYLTLYTFLLAGLRGMDASEKEWKKMKQHVYGGQIAKLPGDIYQAIELFRESSFMKEVMNESAHRKYMQLKKLVADRCPRALGARVKLGEVLYHHEVTNQLLWAKF